MIYNNGQTERSKSPGSSLKEGKELEEAKRLRCVDLVLLERNILDSLNILAKVCKTG